MEQEIPSVNVAVGIIWRKNTFLAAERPLKKPRGGYWEFPGGKQEKGETIEETLVREIQEEIGIECKTMVPCEILEHSYSDLHVTLYFMHVTNFLGEPSPKEGQQLRWVTLEEATKLSFLPADSQLINRIVPPK